MREFFTHLRAHPHIVISGLVGLAAGFLVPHVQSITGRSLVGWNVGVWMYLAWTGWTMMRSDSQHLERVAKAQAESA